MNDIIYISVPKSTPQDEIKAIRDKYKLENKTVMIFISGEEDMKDNLHKLLKTRIS